MSLMTIDELGRLVVRLRLVEPIQLDECLSRLGPESHQSADLLRVLESKHYLTSYQVGQFEKGETDGLVLGNYKLMYRNASGSFARVFRACSLDDDRMIGIKLLRQRWAKDPKTVVQFQREAELCKKLFHKNIVPIYEVGSQGRHHYFTMEFVEGGNLRDFINIRKKLSPAEATRCALDMAEGLEYALSQGITHRDLKLTNVLMSINGVAKLVDFGLAGEGGSSGLTPGDGLMRALEYATLEKGTGAPPNDPRSDLFFLGMIYYELLTGISPYPRTRSREERKQLSRYQNIRPLREADPNIPRSVIDVVERLITLNLATRYQSPKEVVAELRGILPDLSSAANEPAATVGQPVGHSKERESSATPERSLTTVMCIESRGKQQDILREYLSKRGFRVLVLSDVERGLSRLGSNPPDCIVLMGESIGHSIVRAFHDVASHAGSRPTICIAVLAERQSEWKADMEQTGTSRVMIQPITLRELRREIHLSFQRHIRDAKELDSV